MRIFTYSSAESVFAATQNSHLSNPKLEEKIAEIKAYGRVA